MLPNKIRISDNVSASAFKDMIDRCDSCYDHYLTLSEKLIPFSKHWNSSLYSIQEYVVFLSSHTCNCYFLLSLILAIVCNKMINKILTYVSTMTPE